MVPSDIEIRRNHLYKNPQWFDLKYPNNWVVKNLFEIKTARRLLCEANVLENCWAEGQTGFAFVLKSSSPDQGRPWDTTCDLTIRCNRIINSLNGVGVGRWSSAGPVKPDAEPTSRILFEHNLFERFGEQSDFGKQAQAGMMFQVAGRDLTFRHNTAWNGYNLLSLPKSGTDNLVFLDNLVTPGTYALHPDGGGGGWNGGLGTHIRGRSYMEGNTIVRGARSGHGRPPRKPIRRRTCGSIASKRLESTRRLTASYPAAKPRAPRPMARTPAPTSMP